MVDTVLDIIYVLLENTLFVAYLHLLLPSKKESNWKNIVGLASLLSVISYIVNGVLDSSGISGFILIIIPLIYAHIYLEGKPIEKLFKIICININLIVINGVIMLIASVISNSVYQIMYGPEYAGYIIGFFMKGVWMIEYIYLRKYRSQEFQLSKYVWIMISLVLILLIVVVIYTSYELLMGIISEVLAILIFISFGLVVGLIYYVCQEMTNSYNKIIENKVYVEATKYEERLISIATQKSEEYNKILHDYKHLIGVVHELKGQDERLSQYIEDIHFEVPQDIIHTDDVVLNYVINEANQKAKSLGIDFSGEYSKHIYKGISDYDMSILLGNLFDNAIEASQKAKNKKIKYVIDSNEYRMIIKVMNTYDESQFNYLQTTKKDKNKHGFGLSKINNIIHKYNGEDSVIRKDEMFIHSCLLELK